MVTIYVLQALYHSMDKYLQGLFVLANDPVAEVRKLVRVLFKLLSIVSHYLFTIFCQWTIESYFGFKEFSSLDDI